MYFLANVQPTVTLSTDQARIVAEQRTAAFLRPATSQHQLQPGACEDHYTRVPLQSWYNDGRAEYWIAKVSVSKERSMQTTVEKSRVYQCKAEATILAQLEQEEIERLAKQDGEDEVWDAERTRWPEQFANRPLDIIAATARLPRPRSNEDYQLGFWDGEVISSSAEDEMKIQTLLSLLDKMFDRCFCTLTATSYQFQCWMTSFKPTVFVNVHALSMLKSSGGQGWHTRLWKRLFSYVFRVWAQPEHIQLELYGLSLTEQQ
ncbi:hypothetical protein F5884DRAFT_759026 [Xylogone sp. PMI_703]|nr:hypothetical protein F5884DRAFT_759026 [Xylogone sp. PMI_703]